MVDVAAREAEEGVGFCRCEGRVSGDDERLDDGAAAGDTYRMG